MMQPAKSNFQKNEVRALELMKNNPNTPDLIEEVVILKHKLNGLVMSPRGEKLGVVNGQKTLPISAYAVLVETLRLAHKTHGLCHNDICPQNMFAVKSQRANDSYYVILNDWGSSLLGTELETVQLVHIHLLYYDSSKMGYGEDLAALVRSVFTLTQAITIPSTIKNAVELDKFMESSDQWPCWKLALQFAYDCDYDRLKFLLETGTTSEEETSDKSKKKIKTKR
jgi:hypothetical protein